MSLTLTIIFYVVVKTKKFNYNFHLIYISLYDFGRCRFRDKKCVIFNLIFLVGGAVKLIDRQTVVS